MKKQNKKENIEKTQFQPKFYEFFDKGQKYFIAYGSGICTFPGVSKSSSTYAWILNLVDSFWDSSWGCIPNNFDDQLSETIEHKQWSNEIKQKLNSNERDVLGYLNPETNVIVRENKTYKVLKTEYKKISSIRTWLKTCSPDNEEEVWFVKLNEDNKECNKFVKMIRDEIDGEEIWIGFSKVYSNSDNVNA